LYPGKDIRCYYPEAGVEYTVETCIPSNTFTGGWKLKVTDRKIADTCSTRYMMVKPAASAEVEKAAFYKHLAFAKAMKKGAPLAVGDHVVLDHKYMPGGTHGQKDRLWPARHVDYVVQAMTPDKGCLSFWRVDIGDRFVKLDASWWKKVPTPEIKPKITTSAINKPPFRKGDTVRRLETYPGGHLLRVSSGEANRIPLLDKVYSVSSCVPSSECASGYRVFVANPHGVKLVGLDAFWFVLDRPMGSLSKMPVVYDTEGPTEQEYNVIGCPRCGGNHVGMIFKKLHRQMVIRTKEGNPITQYTYWANCPCTGEPLITTYENMTGRKL
jgi:hypothetical protein